MSHQQLQIAPGVYITDFRKGGNLIGLAEQKNELSNDVGLLLDDLLCIDSKISMLQFSIEEIKKEENWEKDQDFKQAIEENWSVIIRLAGEFKEKLLRLFQLKYKPQNEKIQQLMNLQRIENKQCRAEKQLQSIFSINKGGKKEQIAIVDEQEDDNGVFV